MDGQKDVMQPEDGRMDGDGESARDDEGSSEHAEAGMDSPAVRDDDPLGVKKRLGMQAKRHQREMRELHQRVADLQNRLEMAGNASPHNRDQFHSPGQPDPISGTGDEQIQKAVRYALEARDAEERNAKEAESRAHIQRQYQKLNDDFDRASERHEDFDEIVRGDAPFTEAMRDALLLVHNPGDVAYSLGKKRSELERIGKLHPLDQAREITRLSFGLMNEGKDNGKSESRAVNPLSGQPRAMPAGTRGAITDRTPVSEIRARLKAGTWK